MKDFIKEFYYGNIEPQLAVSNVSLSVSGSVKAAQFIVGKQPDMYDMNDVITF